MTGESAGLSPGGVSGPGMATHLFVSKNGSEATIDQALGKAAQAATATARLAAGKAPAPVGAPLAPPAPARAPPAAPAAAPGGPAPTLSAYTAQNGGDALSKNLTAVPFSFSRTTTLARLQSGADSPSAKYPLQLSDGVSANNMMIGSIVATRIESSSPQAIAIRFGSLHPLHTQSRPAKVGAQVGSAGPQYHVKLPVAPHGAETGEKTIFTATNRDVNIQHLMKYGHAQTREDIDKEVDHNVATGVTNVWMDTTVASVLRANKDQYGALRVQTSVGADPRDYVNLTTARVKEIIEIIGKDVLDTPSFKRALTSPSAFDMTLVPLNDSGRWTDVPSLSVESELDAQKEMDRPFTVHIEGFMHVLLIPTKEAGTAK